MGWHILGGDFFWYLCFVQENKENVPKTTLRALLSAVLMNVLQEVVLYTGHKQEYKVKLIHQKNACFLIKAA